MTEINQTKPDWKRSNYLVKVEGVGKSSLLLEVPEQEMDEKFEGGYVKIQIQAYIPKKIKKEMVVGGIYKFTDDEWEDIEILHSELNFFKK